LLTVRGEIFCHTHLSAPWAMAIERRTAYFHLIEAGAAWFQVGNSKKPFETVAGDLVVLPHGDGHLLMDRPGRRAVPLEQILKSASSPSLLRYGGGGAPTEVVCGTFRFGGFIAESMLSILPKVIHVPSARARHFAWLDFLMQLLAEESKGDSPGRRFASSRLVDLLLVLVVRYWLAQQPESSGGWLGAIRDPRIGSALALLHGTPERDWSVPELAAAVGMSRSSLTERFSALVGDPPLTYLTRWRMYLAAKLLESPSASVSEVGGRVGYESEAAFSRAFKRHLGVAPAFYRRSPSGRGRQSPGK
jgi:AraC-like DNA-binding protein